MSRRYGPLALAAGLACAFAAIGVLLAATGSVAGLGESEVRRMAALMLFVSGMVLLSARLQDAVSRWASPLASRAARWSSVVGDGLAGQFAIGALLGAVWSPCVGPTLGAAVGLASSAGARSILLAGAMMFMFGVGSALPLLATAYASRQMLAARSHAPVRWHGGQVAFGVVLVCIGGLTLFGIDKQIEAGLLDQLPRWWIDALAGA